MADKPKSCFGSLVNRGLSSKEVIGVRALIVKVFGRAYHHSNRFPGTMPVHLSVPVSSLSLDYYVAPKIDGERSLLVVFDGSVYCIDRNVVIGRLTAVSLPVHWSGTVIDVEMVDTGISLDFTILDVVAFQGANLMGTPFFTRMKFVSQVERVVPWSHFLLSVKGRVVTRDSVVVKSFIDSGCYDGLILIDCNCHYVTSYDYSLFKWKPQLKVTIDFRVRRLDKKVMLFVKGDEGKEVEYCCSDDPQLMQLHMRIVECGLVDGKWVLHKVRPDKRHPNYIKVVEGAVRAMDADITVAELLEWCGNGCDLANDTRS